MTADDVANSVWGYVLGTATAAERLVHLAGTTGTAAALLLMIGSGATAGEALVDYSGLSSGTAAEHLLVEVDAPVVAPSVEGGGGGFKVERRKQHRKPEGNVREWLLEAFAEMSQEGASPEVVSQVKEALHGHRKPQASEAPRYGLPPISSIDLQALLRDIEALALIEFAYQRFLAEEDEDEDMLLMMGY